MFLNLMFLRLSRPTPVVNGDRQSLSLAVINASGKPEVGAKTIAFFKRQGFGNVYLSDHEVESNTASSISTQIIAQHGNPEAADTVRHAIGFGQVQVASTGDLASDVTVVIGADLEDKLKYP